jgi:hypothetical protein
MVPCLIPRHETNQLTLSVSSTLKDFSTQEGGFSWMLPRSWDVLWAAGIGGSGARLFLGASDGRVFETYGLERVLDLVKDGRCLFISGVAGALAV